MKKHLFLVSMLFFIVVLPASGQSNERIDELIAQNPAESGHVAYIVLAAAGIVDENDSPDDAVGTAISEGLLPEGSLSEYPITFGRFSFLLTESFGVPCGVMYRLLPGPRYAAREVVYRQWSRKRRSPTDLIDGETVVRILSVYLNEEGSR